jgi:predicted transcriptional regulator
MSIASNGHYVTERELIVLLGIRDKKTIVEIAESIGKSQGTVQKIRKSLMNMELVAQKTGPKGGGLHRSHYLTPDGIAILEDKGHAV